MGCRSGSNDVHLEKDREKMSVAHLREIAVAPNPPVSVDADACQFALVAFGAARH